MFPILQVALPTCLTSPAIPACIADAKTRLQLKLMEATTKSRLVGGCVTLGRSHNAIMLIEM
uniref:Uncharacterized protein n=1 Tax=Anguilla anguilla TaxID=7936 RepID=A0A0E9VSD4_ANGAN